MTLPADLFPGRAVGSVAGLVGSGGAMGGIVFGEASGRDTPGIPGVRRLDLTRNLSLSTRSTSATDR